VAFKTPETKLEANRQYRARNAEKLRAYYKARGKTPEEKARRKAYKEANRAKVLASLRASSRKFRVQLRQSIIAHFGGKCVRCGFADWRALQIDHVKGGGSKERKSSTNNHQLYKGMLKAPPGTYQLLCANCNQIKRYEENENANFMPD
jgi:hypothetical protein